MNPRTRSFAKAKLRGSSRTRLAVSFFMALAVLLQSYATQTHIHVSARASVFAAASGFGPAAPVKASSGSQSGDHDKYPANEDPANCPLCQEVLHSGAFVAPSAAAVWLPLAFVVLKWTAPNERVHIVAPSHGWRGRAPPTR